MNIKKEVSILLHNIRSVHNVGSIFRTADAAGVSKIYLSGYTPRPVDRFGREVKAFSKVALGGEKFVPWEYIESPELLIQNLKKYGTHIMCLEQDTRAIDYKAAKPAYPLLFIVGNEVEGIEKNILKEADTIVQIDMKGKKESLNVAVSFGIALFRILNI